MIIKAHLAEYCGLSELMIAAQHENCTIFGTKDVCSVSEIESAGVFEAFSSDFHFAMVFPGWHSGDCAVHPVSVFMDGDLRLLLQWLPIEQADKQAIIGELPISQRDKVLLWLSV
jgi:hypothetical protein